MTSSSQKHRRRVVAPGQSKSIPISGTRRTHSELEIAQAELLADYQDGRMYERILTGILRRCDQTMDNCHPKTITSLENIMRTKMLDYGSFSEQTRSHTSEDWVIGDECNPIHSLPAREPTRRKVTVSSLCSSSGPENETLDSSISTVSCFSTTQIKIDHSEWDAAHEIEGGIFELEL